jgi:ribosomal protein L11 methyltransferase
MDYIEISFKNFPGQNEMLIALLSEEDYESFEESEDGLKAYIPAEKFLEEKIMQVIQSLKSSGNISFTKSLIKDQNWNALWESNFEPVLIGDSVYVHAPFHPAKPGIKYDIEIEPKMSFGTGHHATTLLMMEEMLKMNLKDETILDMGCGSGILAILASKMGAKNILAIDIEEWAFKNACENCQRNQSQHIIVQKGNANLIHGKSFTVILANINRNILLEDMEAYVKTLQNKGHLLVSGFIEADLNTMLKKAEQFNLQLENHAEKNSWSMAHFKKVS